MPETDSLVPSEECMMRPSWDDYFVEILDIVKTRSTCLRRQVGAIIVRDNRILATGYNGAPAGIAHCEDTGCLRQEMGIPSGKRQELCRGLHAEQNAIIQAALYGSGIKGSTLYCTNKPCITCAKMIINAGIIRVVYKEDYPDEFSDKFFKESGIKVDIYSQMR